MCCGLCVAACVVRPWWACVAHQYPLPPLLSLCCFLAHMCVLSLFASSGSSQIREHKDSGIYVEGMSETFVTTPAAVYDAIRRGSENRAVASTNMNRDSSRSHSVFILYVPCPREMVAAGVGAWASGGVIRLHTSNPSS